MADNVTPVPPTLPPAASSQPSFRRGFVKQVLSGDAVVLQGQPTNGPPPETTVYLSNVVAPRLAKRPTETTAATVDEPFAWDSREFLRKKLVGQVVTFVKEFTAASGRDHGKVYLGGTNPDNAENVTETGVAEGWLEVRPGKIADEYVTKLLELQDQAKASGKGKWGSSSDSIREVKWVIENPRQLVDHYKQKPVDAVVEMVRDGSTLRVMLLPSFEYITLQLSGVRAPATRAGTDGKAEAFAEEAKYFVEQRLLQQDVQVILESTSNQNVVGSVVHPKGNIAESLLREGYAKCVDWSIGLCTGGAERLRAAEKQAKDKKLRLWRTYQPSAASALTGDKKSFTGKVVEVIMSDAMVVRKADGSEVKIHLASVRLPRDSDEKPSVGRQFRPLYDVPFMFQAREFLRKRLIGKNVNVTVDYIQPKSEQFPEKTCCTVKVGELNIAEALILKGLSKVVRHRSDDENRSSEYDALLAAEANAEKSKKGLFADKTADKKDTLRIQELQGDLARSKQFLPYLQRSTRAEGVVEFIASGSRLRIYIPKETVVITFLLGGINCPKSGRPGPGGITGPSEPFADEATAFTRRMVLQHEVEIEVEGLDKMGNFIGYLFVTPEAGGKPQNLSELLLDQGLATLHFTAEKSGHYNQLVAAEQRAKAANRNIWQNYKEEEVVPDEVVAQQNDVSERRIQYKKVAVTDITKGTLNFAAQLVEDGAKLEKMTADLREYLRQHPPMTGAFSAKRGDVCAAPFSVDGLWYRAKVESVRSGQAEVLFIDYGNREAVPASSLAQLPPGFAHIPAGAKEYGIALVAIPNDKEYGLQCEDALQQLLFSVPTAEINVEYKIGSTEYCQVMIECAGKKVDVGKALIEDGFALVEKRKEKRLQSMLSDYEHAEQKARRERKNIWEFGDFTGNDL
ncbi:nuclease-like protein [Necator americanus]|uniref:Staphylococcal nuclease domain-containing protein 1 n=1 Tax=Necator americanus TaxID=51031 RepID=W2SWW7_NECAM|nr:nuclease-like protein [Necator americanus]ETN74249.1 nuclease-like protein [Necator americanus]